MEKRQIEKKLLDYHTQFDDGQIPVYNNVVILGETIVSLDGDDRDCVAIILHDENKLEGVFHLSLEAAVKLAAGIGKMLEEDDESN